MAFTEGVLHLGGRGYSLTWLWGGGATASWLRGVLQPHLDLGGAELQPYLALGGRGYRAKLAVCSW